MADNVDKLIEDFESYLRTVKRFYGTKLVVDSSDQASMINSPNEDTYNVGEASLKKKHEDRIAFKDDKKTHIEFDLFGNIVRVKEEWEFSENLQELNTKICDCQKCVLGSSRTKFVFGVGNPKADIVLIGEAPGADEDAQGEPFVGRAGQLLNKILDVSGFKREEVFICNILKCRPPGNRNPLPEEIEQCRPYLERQLKLINPKLILLLGRVAAESLLKTKEPLNKLRGKIHDYKGYKVMITFHPAALLRNSNWKRPTWEDMKQFKALYEELSNKK